MSFWDIIWFIIVSFAFIAYLMVLFNIVVDLFRDKTVSGGMKALWMVLLIFFPILTAIVYLIVRGDKMAHRHLESIAAANEANQAYVRSIAGSTSPAEQISQAKALLDSGAIDEAEFAALKAKALG